MNFVVTQYNLIIMAVLNMYQIDLVNTIGESAAMGASGVIIWEKSLAVKTQVIIQSFVHHFWTLIQ